MTSNEKNASWWGYYNQYKMLTDKLIREDRDLLDGVVTLPFLYCLSHTIELGFKASIIDFTGNLPDKSKNHNLQQLFSFFKEELVKSMEKQQLIELAKLNILKVVDELQDLVELYKKLNPIHQSLKYPINNKSEILFNFHDGIDNKGVNIEQIIILYNKTNRLITWITSVLCDQYIVDDVMMDDIGDEYM